jgi:UDP-GlcNAc:undecaprenyl-phosphate GlcNAc-1-phosphate transferase
MFLGDGGAKFIGFIQIVSAIGILESLPRAESFTWQHFMLMALFILPVLDVIRVAIHRMSHGQSPFNADKKHLHHLVISMGYTHMKSTVLIVVLHISIIAVFTTVSDIIGLLAAAVGAFVSFILLIQVLKLNKGLQKWQREIRKMEKYEHF